MDNAHEAHSPEKGKKKTPNKIEDADDDDHNTDTDSDNPWASRGYSRAPEKKTSVKPT